MTIAGTFAPGVYASRRAGESFGSLRSEMVELQRQLATGKRADSYAGLGSARGVSLNVRAKLSALSGYKEAIQGAEVRVKVMTLGVEKLAGMVRDTKSELLPPAFELRPDGRTLAQHRADENLKLAIDIFNSQVNGRHLFGGREVDQPPVIDYKRLMDGDATHVGLKDYITARLAMGVPDASTAAKEFFDARPGAPAPTIPGVRQAIAWYQGEDADTLQDPIAARASTPVQTDANQSVGVGASAFEPAFRNLMAQLGALATQSFVDTPADRTRYETLVGQVQNALTPQPGQQKVEQVAVDLGSAAAAMKNAKDRHTAGESIFAASLDAAEEMPAEEAGAKLLALQTRLQASYQTTSILSRLSLVNYL